MAVMALGKKENHHGARDKQGEIGIRIEAGGEGDVEGQHGEGNPCPDCSAAAPQTIRKPVGEQRVAEPAKKVEAACARHSIAEEADRQRLKTVDAVPDRADIDGMTDISVQ